jgi:ribosomal protein S27AE
MGAKVSPMTCPRCGVQMNHHAEKVVKPPSPERDSLINEAWGGALEEFHTCPECGAGASRKSIAT